MRPGKFGTTLAALAVAASLLAAGTAFAAAQTIVAADNAGANSFSQATYTMDQGEKAPFQNIGLNQHNATATVNGPDGRPLFSSPTIGMGSTIVEGTQYLTTGGYTFICTIHPSTMIATLQVSANGTPVPRPTLALRLLSRQIEKVLRNGLLVRLDVGTKADDITLEARLGTTLIGKGQDVSEATGTSFVKLKLNRAGKSRLRKREKATISLMGTIPFGAPTTAKGKLK
jgi:plastocyanin